MASGLSFFFQEARQRRHGFVQDRPETVGQPGLDAAAAHVEFGVVPGADDVGAFEFADGERGGEVGAGVLDGEDFAVHVGDADALAVDFGGGDFARSSSLRGQTAVSLTAISSRLDDLRPATCRLRCGIALGARPDHRARAEISQRGHTLILSRRIPRPLHRSAAQRRTRHGNRSVPEPAPCRDCGDRRSDRRAAGAARRDAAAEQHPHQSALSRGGAGYRFAGRRRGGVGVDLSGGQAVGGGEAGDGGDPRRGRVGWIHDRLRGKPDLRAADQHRGQHRG